MKQMRECGHEIEVDDQVAAMFGPDWPACDECRETMELYTDARHAIAGNVYSLARLAKAGYIPGVHPTKADLDNAERAIYAQLTAKQQAAVAAR